MTFPYLLHWIDNSGLHFVVDKLLQVAAGAGGVVYAGGHRQEWDRATRQRTEAILHLAPHRFAALHNARRDAGLT